MTKKVLTIHLNDKLNELLTAAVQENGAELAACHSEEDSYMAMTRHSYCLVILDASGLTAAQTRRCLERMRLITFAPILVLTPEQATGELIEAGADFCLSDAMPPENIVSHALSLQRRYLQYNHYDVARPNDAVLYRGNLVIDPLRYRVTLSGKEIELRRREFRLLLYFARNPGIVLKAEQICESVWMTDYNYGNDISSVIAILRRKLNDDRDNPTYIETVRGVGYRFLPER